MTAKKAIQGRGTSRRPQTIALNKRVLPVLIAIFMVYRRLIR
jgi:hypothetical protein